MSDVGPAPTREIAALFDVALGDKVNAGGPMTRATLARAVERARARGA